MQHSPVHDCVITGDGLALSNADCFACTSVTIIFAVCDDWDGCGKGAVIPEDSSVVGCDNIGSCIALAFYADLDFTHLSHLVAFGEF